MAEPVSSQFIQTLRNILAAAEAGQIPGAVTPAASPAAAPAPAPVAAPEPQAPAPRPAAPQQQQQQQQQSSSLLQQLRERATRELAGAPAQQEDPRVAFGRGVLSNRGSFLDNLSAGLQAQREAETARQTALAAQREEMRRIAEAERMEQARRDQAEYQRQSLEFRRQEAERAGRPQFQVVGTDARGNAVVMDPRDPTRRQVLEGVTPSQVSALNARLTASDLARAAAAGNQAVRDEERRRADALPRQPELTAQERDRLFQEASERFLRSTQTGGAGATGGGATGSTQPAPAAPARTLQYPRAPQQQQ